MPIENLNPQGVLAQVKNVVSKQLYKALSYLLNPCCTIDTIKGVDVTALKVAGSSLTNQDVTVLILSKDSPYVVGKATITLDGIGNGSV